MSDKGTMGGGGPKKISISIQGHQTSVSLEPAFWDAFRALCHADGTPTKARLEEIDRDRTGALSSAVRLWVLDRLIERAALKP